MTNQQAIERAYSASLVDAMKNQASAREVLAQIDPENDTYEYVETVVFAFDNIIGALIERAKGDGVWRDISHEGACLRAFIVAGGK